ncbi:MAG: GT-D fold domain-containing protein [Planctomycetaceae bacterium]|jgi:hypothetical protein|nr:GT-D fold domain-containing protein [Planctomycetaceae bacterium]
MTVERCFSLLSVKLWKLLLYIPFIGDREAKRVADEFPRILSLEETIDRLAGGNSIVRYGDGEIRLCMGHHLSFQHCHPVLQKRLIEILQHTQQDRFLVGLNPYTADIRNISWKGCWEQFIALVRKDILLQKNTPRLNRRYNYQQWNWMQYWRFMKSFIPSAVYANAEISRLDVFQAVPLDKIKAIWNDRDIVFIVPKNGKFVYEPRLFDNMRSIEYIYIKAVDAFNDYDRIMSEALYKEKNKIFFISAGPTATVLAYDLYKAGYQALDFGHLPNCYREFLGEAPAPEQLPPAK